LNLLLRKANSAEAPSISALVNKAYRGETSRKGWTTEADLLSGLRTDTKEIEQLLSSGNSLLLLCLLDHNLVGSVCLEKQGNTAHLGMFAVDPLHQGQGIGKHLLAFAETTAVETWSVGRMVMSVITLRVELMAFYLRRGYRCSGELKPFPTESKLWHPLVSGLQLEVLEKNLCGA
jgi:GNAT superfamily N-acetyltransferase